MNDPRADVVTRMAAAGSVTTIKTSITLAVVVHFHETHPCGTVAPGSPLHSANLARVAATPAGDAVAGDGLSASSAVV